MNIYEKKLNQLVHLSIISNENGVQIDDSDFISNTIIEKIDVHKIHTQLQREYSYISIFKYQNIDVVEKYNQEKEKLVKLISWVIENIKNWKCNDTDSKKELKFLLNVTQFLDKNGCLWKIFFNQKVSINDELIKYSIHQLSGLKSQLEANKSSPINEKESLDRLLSAIPTKDWFEISEAWRPFESTFPPLSIYVSQMFCLLDYFDPKLLISIFEESDDFVVLMNVMSDIRIETSLLIGSRTNNDYLEFASVYSALYFRRNISPLSNLEEELLISIFSKIGRDNKKFILWMKVFNKYPMRYPKIQIALGKMLSKTTDIKNIEAYITSISLSNYSENKSRLIVTSCLKEIIKNSNSARKNELFEISYKVWSDWNFGEIEKSGHIFNVVNSELDMAVIGYFKECISSDERLEIEKNILKELKMITNKWHASQSDANTYWYRFLSFYNVLEQANNACDNIDEWLLEDGFYIPDEFHKNGYQSMLLRV